MKAYYELKPTTDGRVMFNLVAGNGEIIAHERTVRRSLGGHGRDLRRIVTMLPLLLVRRTRTQT
jgi:hypothetical protein